MATACQSIEALIRNATRHAHGSLDAALSRVDLGRPDYYASFLRGQAEALIPLEAALELHGVDQLLPDWPQRARTPALEHDLAALDVACDPLPVPALGTGAEATAKMLGILYVLEAMRLASRSILQRLAERPEAEVIIATSYLRHGFGRRFWPSFLEVLELHPAARALPGEVIEGARLAFGMFDSAVTPTLLGTLDRARSTLRLVAAAH
jgi:heme oxygenase